MMNCKAQWFSSLFLLTASSLCGQPHHPQVIAGDASFEQINPHTYQIKADDRSIVQWKSFGIKPGERTLFKLPSSQAVVLNRVVGKKISYIDGTLESNGCVY